MSCYPYRAVDTAFHEVLQGVTVALEEEHFGTLTGNNVQAALKAQLGADIPPYRGLGARKPSFGAHLPLRLEDKLVALLPCNVIMRDAGDGQAEVAATDR
jgi:uncharacterized protein (DUF302 family)